MGRTLSVGGLPGSAKNGLSRLQLHTRPRKAMVIRRFLESFFDGSKSSEPNDVTPIPVQAHQLDRLPPTAQQLERRSLLLKRTGTDLAAIWGGDGIVPPPPGPYRHWISVDSRYLASGFTARGV